MFLVAGEAHVRVATRPVTKHSGSCLAVLLPFQCVGAQWWKATGVSHAGESVLTSFRAVGLIMRMIYACPVVVRTGPQVSWRPMGGSRVKWEGNISEHSAGRGQREA